MFEVNKFLKIREWILENKGCPFCKTPIIPEDTNSIPRVNNLNNDMINDPNIGLGNNEEFQNNRNVIGTENKTSNEKQLSIQDGFNVVINPPLEKIKLYKEHLKSKVAYEYSIIDTQKQQYNEKEYLSNFASGAVEYGLPCEVVYNRSLEVNLFYINFLSRMK